MSNHIVDQSGDDGRCGEYDWAIDIVADCFRRGLQRRFPKRGVRHVGWQDDPVYAEILRSLDDEALAEAFVFHWKLGQTMAAESRFWIEEAIARITIEQVREFGRRVNEVYTHSMLLRGYLERRLEVSELGESDLEHIMDRRPWAVPLQRSVRRCVDDVIAEQEAGRPDPATRRTVQRDWHPGLEADARRTDHACLTRVRSAFSGPPVEDVRIQCNLLVVGPDSDEGRNRVQAIRFVNPKRLAVHSDRQRERRNLLRTYGYLVQEKILDDPQSISVCVAEIVPRRAIPQLDVYPDYFSDLTHWNSERLWDYLGVPFESIAVGIRRAATELRDQVRDYLRSVDKDSSQ